MWCPPCLAVAPVAYPVGKAVAIRPQVCLAEPCGQRGHRPTSGRLRSLRQLPPFFEANPPLEEHPAAGGAEEREHLLRKDILYLKKGQAAKRHGKKAREKDRVHVSARTLPRTVKQYGHQTESGTEKNKMHGARYHSPYRSTTHGARLTHPAMPQPHSQGEEEKQGDRSGGVGTAG